MPNNEEQVTEIVEEPKNDPAATESEAPKDPEDNGIDSEKTVKKLQKRIGKEQSEKHSLQDQLDKANAKIAELTKSKKGIKELSDEEKAKQAESDKDKQIDDLQKQIKRMNAVADTDAVLKEAGLNVGKDILNMIVSDNDDQTYANAKAIIEFSNHIGDTVKQEMLKGKTPTNQGHTVATKPFNKMTLMERVALKQKDPKGYADLAKKNGF